MTNAFPCEGYCAYGSGALMLWVCIPPPPPAPPPTHTHLCSSSSSTGSRSRSRSQVIHVSDALRVISRSQKLRFRGEGEGQGDAAACGSTREASQVPTAPGEAGWRRPPACRLAPPPPITTVAHALTMSCSATSDCRSSQGLAASPAAAAMFLSVGTGMHQPRVQAARCRPTAVPALQANRTDHRGP